MRVKVKGAENSTEEYRKRLWEEGGVKSKKSSNMPNALLHASYKNIVSVVSWIIFNSTSATNNNNNNNNNNWYKTTSIVLIAASRYRYGYRVARVITRWQQFLATIVLSVILVISAVVLVSARPQHDYYQGYHGPPAPIGHDGRVVDTPEVAQAKAAHLAALREATARISQGASPVYAGNHNYYEGGSQERAYDTPVLHSGVFRGSSAPGYFSAETYGSERAYHGPTAPLDHEGRVVDTPEVAKAKAAHFAAYNHLASKVPHGPVTSGSEESFADSGSFEDQFDTSGFGNSFQEQPFFKDFASTYGQSSISRVASSPPLLHETIDRHKSRRIVHLDSLYSPTCSAVSTRVAEKNNSLCPLAICKERSRASLANVRTTMRTLLIMLSLFGIAVASPAYYVPAVIPYNYPLDTPEVAQAKAVHLATQAYEAARNTLGYAYVPAFGSVYTPVFGIGAPIGADGRVVDTPEVAQAKAAHLAAHAQEAAKNEGAPYGALAYATSHNVYNYGEARSAPLASDGRVIDTPDVAKAKAVHLAIHAEEAAKTASQ
ncbi:uncharacterized protein [Prorops nasuta]|uniref:uncharacterized protein n=1 Tax=Prorops nasuta TaxID=863751 RepID=UPI0034CEC309